MFERQDYKKQARIQLSQHWKVPLLISLIAWGVSQCLSMVYNLIVLPSTSQVQLYGTEALVDLGFTVFTGLLYSLYGIIMIAASSFYLSFVKDNKSTFTTFLESFALWSKGLRGYLWTYLWGFLWALLFIIPGIVKLLAYSQMYYIMAENPKVGVRKAMKISMEMTKGHKGELFTMYLSFLGWILLLAIFPIAIVVICVIFLPTSMANTLLVSLSFVIFMLVQPYMDTSFTYAYHYMKQDAMNRKILTYADFGEVEPLSTVEESTPMIEQAIPNIDDATPIILEAPPVINETTPTSEKPTL